MPMPVGVTTDIVPNAMSDPVTPPPIQRPATPSRRGQSMVEFALVLPMLLVLLLGVADVGRVFAAGIIVEASARNAAEAAAQEYLQLRRNSAPPTSSDYDRIRDVAFAAVCDEAERLPDRVGSGAACVSPASAICIHDDAAELPGYTSCGATTAGAAAQCTALSGWASGKPADRLPYVEVRVCYEFKPLFTALGNLELPLSSGINLGTIWLQKDRSFSVADY